MDCRTALKDAASGSLKAMADRLMWAGILAGAVATVVLLVRLLVLVTFPVSTPLIAWLLILDERRTAEQVEQARARLRRGIHQNGPGRDGTAIDWDTEPPPLREFAFDGLLALGFAVVALGVLGAVLGWWVL